MTGPASARVVHAAIAVGQALGISYTTIFSKRRDHTVSYARHVVAYAMRTALGRSYPEIGKELGCDHTTVMHACKRIAGLVADSGDHGYPIHAHRLVTLAVEAMGQRRVAPPPPDDWWARYCTEVEARRAS